MKESNFLYHKEGHLRKHYPEREKDQEGFSNFDSATISNGYESSEVLTVSTARVNNEWIMDSGCTFYMTPKKEYFGVGGGKKEKPNIVGVGGGHDFGILCLLQTLELRLLFFFL